MEVGTLKELNVKPGDVVEWEFNGRRATIEEWMIDAWDGQYTIISRASDAPKTWGEMTDAEKGALLLAAHEGKVIEWLVPECDHTGTEIRNLWVQCIRVGHYRHYAYRIKPEPKRETVAIEVRRTTIGWESTRPSHYNTHRITFDLIDGETDCDSVKMEKL